MCRDVSVVGRRQMCSHVLFDSPGTGGMIYAQAHLGRALRVQSLRDFNRHADMHKMTVQELPYKKTFLIPILSLRKIKRPYVHPRGAISIVKYCSPMASA